MGDREEFKRMAKCVLGGKAKALFIVVVNEDGTSDCVIDAKRDFIPLLGHIEACKYQVLENVLKD